MDNKSSTPQPNTSYDYPDKPALLDALAYIWSDDNDMFNESNERDRDRDNG